MGWKKSGGGRDRDQDQEGGAKSTLIRRRQGVGTRVWVVVNEAGDYQEEEFGKQQIMRRTGIPARDLRPFDPVLSYPSSIPGRERAIGVNLEHIKAIITATEVLVVNSSNSLVVNFVQDLRHRITGGFSHQIKAKESSDSYTEGEECKAWTSSAMHPHEVSPQTLIKWEACGDEASGALSGHLGALGLNRSLPFEFKALEACLESACKCLQYETRSLEKEAYPALDELTSHISTLNLERVRQIKSRLIVISSRVQRVRDELEHLLDDDNDMAEMYLAEKLRLSIEPMYMRADHQDNDPVELGDGREDEDVRSRYSEAYTSAKPDIEELEMLLEAYFAQIDGISQQLSTMSEYAGDTEDYVNIMLDDKQNQLLEMGVMLSAASMVIGVGLVVSGLFGMNIKISWFKNSPRGLFLHTTLGIVAACFFLYLLLVGWAQKRVLF
ncbi:hypothetical protein Cgig2_015111 [Carnegiea gigantea]|uniref:Magnesium transporter n=1 Tax=Carnegiea gigantea TaxID=171969 RepID=A0A9Q1QM48_9CARY|nr:hypothetical protein Cgig2_015111 [Carnegiea gigantea]